MNAAPSVYGKQYRLAQHYLGRLRSASHTYRRGDENTLYGLKLAQQDWSQIQQWQAWAANRAAHEREAAVLCSAYSLEAGDLLDLLLTPDEHRHWLEAALIRAQQLGDQQAELAHLLALGEIHHKLDDYPPALDYTRQALDLARQRDDQGAFAQGLVTLGQIARLQGRYDESLEFLQQSLSISRSLQDQTGIARNLLGLAELLNTWGKRPQIRPYVEESLHLYRQLGDRRGTGLALRFLALSILNEDTPLAQKYLKESLELFRQSGSQNDNIEAYDMLVLSYIYLRDFEQAQTLAEEGLRLSRQLLRPFRIAFFLVMLGWTAEEQGKLDDAHHYYAQSLEVSREMGNVRQIGVTLLNLCIIDMIRGDVSSAVAYAEEALVVERKHNHPINLLDALGEVAIVYSGLGLIEPARDLLREIVAINGMTITPESSLRILIAQAFLSLKTNQAEFGTAFFGVVEQRPYPKELLTIIRFLRAALQAALGEEAFAAALERGSRLDYDATVAEIIAELNE